MADKDQSVSGGHQRCSSGIAILRILGALGTDPIITQNVNLFSPHSLSLRQPIEYCIARACVSYFCMY